jgi:hypothetical protein
LEDLIESAIRIPITGKCLLDKDELLDIIQEIRLKLPDDLKQAKWVKEERQRILSEAQKEANETLKNAEDKIIAMINENEITKRSYEKANEIEALSQKRAKELKLATNLYIEERISDVEKLMENTLAELRANREELRAKYKNK